MQILLKIIYFINLILLFSFAANAQNEENDNNDPQTKTSIVNETFPIAVVDMQYIVSKSTAAFKASFE